jgi:hypothetical protein
VELNRQDAKIAEEEEEGEEFFDYFPLDLSPLPWPLLASWRFNSPVFVRHDRKVGLAALDTTLHGRY